MARFLVQSIQRSADLPGPWKVIFTVSRDTAWDFHAPELSWARDYPVEFRWADERLWEKRGILGTCQQTMDYRYDSDVVLYLDADLIVVGSLREIVDEVSRADQVAAWPAWMPPPQVDLDAILQECGLTYDSRDISYSGYAIDFMEPRFCPPYFNCAFVAASRNVAEKIGRTYASDMDFVCERHTTYLATQIAFCTSILRSGVSVRVLDERYNYGHAEWGKRPCSGPETDSAIERSNRCAQDIRVLHYSMSTEYFQKFRELASLDALRAFCDRTDVGEAHARLQRGFRRLLDAESVPQRSRCPDP
jgi:hypothetical protein